MNRKILLLLLIGGQVQIESAEGGAPRRNIHSGYTGVLGGDPYAVLVATAVAGLKGWFSSVPAQSLPNPSAASLVSGERKEKEERPASLPAPVTVILTPEEAQAQTVAMITYAVEIKKTGAIALVEIGAGTLTLKNVRTQQQVTWTFPMGEERKQLLEKFRATFSKLLGARDSEVIESDFLKIASYSNRLNGSPFDKAALKGLVEAAKNPSSACESLQMPDHPVAVGEENLSSAQIVEKKEVPVITVESAEGASAVSEIHQEPAVSAGLASTSVPAELIILSISEFNMAEVMRNALEERELVDQLGANIPCRLFFYDEKRQRLLMKEENSSEVRFCWNCRELQEEEQASVRQLALLLTRYLLTTDPHEADLFTKNMIWVESQASVSSVAGAVQDMHIEDQVALLEEGFESRVPACCRHDVVQENSQLLGFPTGVTVVRRQVKKVTFEGAGPQVAAKSPKAKAMGYLIRITTEFLGQKEGALLVDDLLRNYLEKRVMARVINPQEWEISGLGGLPVLQFGRDEDKFFREIPSLSSVDKLTAVCSAWNEVVAAYQDADAE